MRILWATLTYLPEHDGATGSARDVQVGVQSIAGVVSFTLVDGTLLEFDERQLQGALFFAAHEDAAA